MFLSKSMKSQRKKKAKKDNDKSERKMKAKNTKKAKDKERSERTKKARAEYKKEEVKEKEGAVGTTGGGTTGSGSTTGSGGTGAIPDQEEEKEKARKIEENEKKKKEEPPPPVKEPWTGEDAAKRMLASGVFNSATFPAGFKELCTIKPTQDDCPRFKQNVEKVRAPDLPILDEKLVKLYHAPDGFICAAKIAVPEFTRTMILTQVPDVTVPTNIEDFWRMIFHEEVVSVVIALMPLECSVTLQQLFPISNSTFANHGKMFVNNKKVESSVGVTAYTLELLPEGCSNSFNTTVHHLHNWRQKRGLDSVGDLATLLDKVVKLNENTVFVSMKGAGRAGTMLSIFTAMVHINKDKDVKMKEIVDKLRLERCGIVESAEQFVTIHKVLAAWFKKKSQDEEIAKKVAEFSPGL